MAELRDEPRAGASELTAEMWELRAELGRVGERLTRRFVWAHTASTTLLAVLILVD